MDSATPEYSVVIPIYNEADNLVALVEEIHGALAPLGKPWEVLAVDDCSRDQSLSVLRRLKTSHPELRILRHRVNCGQSAAFATGVAHARGNVIITMDSDRQNDRRISPGCSPC